MKSLPTESQVRASDLRSTPFGHLLIELLEAGQTGTVLVYDETDSLHAAIFVESGRPQKALADHEGEHNLGTVLLPLCGWATGRFEFIEGQDLVGTDSPVRGTVDPVALIAAAARGPLREDVLEQAMNLVTRSFIKAGHRLEPRRYGFNAQEQRVLSAIGAGPISYEDLRNQLPDMPERVMQRVLYVLRLTRGIGLISTQRMVSGTLTRPGSLAPESFRPTASRSTPSQPIAPPFTPDRSQPPRAPSGPVDRAPSRRPDPTASGHQPISRNPEPSSRATLPEAPSRPPLTQSQPVPRAARPAATTQPNVLSQPPAQSQRPGRSQPPVRSQRPKAGSISETSSPPSRSSQSRGAHPVGGSDPARASRPSDPRFMPPSLPPTPSSLPPQGPRREDPEALWKKAEAMGRRNEFDAALQTAKQAMKLGGTRPEHDALLGWLLFAHGAGDPEVLPHVWRCIDRALKRESMCEQALYYKALVLNMTGEADQARAHLQRVLMLNPDHTDAAHELRIMEMRRTHEQQQTGFLRRLLNGKSK